MTRFLARRLAQAAIAVAGVMLVVFFLIHASGDPATLLLPPQASKAARAAFRHAYGLDRPLYLQFGLYLARALHGDFGTSIREGQPALSVVLRRAPATLLLTSVSMAVSIFIGVAAGVLAAVHRGGWIDRLAILGAMVGQSVPGFWLGLLLIWLFAVVWPLLPPSGYGSPSQLVLPTLTLSPWLAALVARLMRSSMLEVLHEDYIRTAYAKGAHTSRVVFRHAFRNAVMPTLAMIGLSFAYYLGGAIVVEYVFGWPGIGTLMLDSITWRDYPVVLTIVTLVAVAFICVNLLIDMLHGVIDPRVRGQEMA